MHISEGILTAPVLLSGAALTTIGTTVGLRKMDYDRIPQVAILSAAFFIASLIHVPIGPSNVHLIINGLVGLFLGWVAFPAILVGLILQTLLFQYGGFTSLGINSLNMALPALVCFYLFGSGVRSKKTKISSIASFMCGFVAVFMGSLMVAFSLFISGEYFLTVARFVVVAHIPVMFIEGFISLFCVRFLKAVKPEILEVVYER
ncbi:cobalt transporter CbiM [Thermodesulfobacteriota bacterium]